MPVLKLTPILPVSERLLGISLVCSIVELMSSSKSEILTDWDSACERDSFVLMIKVHQLERQACGKLIKHTYTKTPFSE
jgi:hypothetical protein